jgi:hypothetical protein
MNQLNLMNRLLLLGQAGLLLAGTPPQTPRRLLAAPPESVSSSASSQVLSLSPDPFASDALIEAYRMDLADPGCKVYLGFREANHLAAGMGVGAECYQVVPGPRSSKGLLRIEKYASINGRALQREPWFFILAHGRHFLLVARQEEDEPPVYVETTKKAREFVETGDYNPQTGEEQRVPRDGNSLLFCLHFIRFNRFPTPVETAFLRERMVKDLTLGELREGVSAMVADLLDHAAKRPFNGGRFATWGPRASTLLAADPAFKAARARALKAQGGRLADDEETLAQGAEAADASVAESVGAASRAAKKAHKKAEAKRKAKETKRIASETPLVPALVAAPAAPPAPAPPPAQDEERAGLMASVEWILAEECSLEPLQTLLTALKELEAAMPWPTFPEPRTDPPILANQVLEARLQGFTAQLQAAEGAYRTLPLEALQALEGQLKVLIVDLVLLEAEADERLVQARVVVLQVDEAGDSTASVPERVEPAVQPPMQVPGFTDSREAPFVQAILAAPEAVLGVHLQNVAFWSEEAARAFPQALGQCKAAQTVSIFDCYLNGQSEAFYEALVSMEDLGMMSIMRMQLGSSFMPTLARILTQDQKLFYLSLRQNHLTLQNLDELCLILLNQSHSLAYLDFANNPLGYGNTTFYIESLLAHGHSLQSLNLDACNLGDASAIRFLLAIADNPVLRHLSLANNGITSEGAKVLAALLGLNKHLTYLDLGMNAIGEAGLGPLLKAIQDHPTLQVVNVQGVEIVSMIYQLQINQILAARQPAATPFQPLTDGLFPARVPLPADSGSLQNSEILDPQ